MARHIVSRPIHLALSIAQLLAVIPILSCSKGATPRRQLLQAPDLAIETGQAKCPVQRSSEKPLIVEWPAAERGQLESLVSRQLVVVRYAGCEMELLPTCQIEGTYDFIGLNKKSEIVEIHNTDELYATIPVGAAHFEGELNRLGELGVEMTIVGRKEAPRNKFESSMLHGQRCADATHVITGISMGAFSFYSVESASRGAGLSVGPAEAGGSSSKSRRILRQDGDRNSCNDSGADELDAPSDCSALIRIEVSQISAPSQAEAMGIEKDPSEAPGEVERIFISEGTLWGTRIAPFYIDKTEVTVSEYSRCVQAGACDPLRTHKSDQYNWGKSARHDHPINGVTWQNAHDFCAWRGKRLPTKTQWEWAAQGEDEDRPFPWGEERATCDHMVMNDGSWGCGTGRTWAVGTKPADVTRDGILDMAGNLSEWTYDSHQQETVASGRSFRETLQFCNDGDFLATCHASKRWGFYSPDIGFRCVTPTEPIEEPDVPASVRDAHKSRIITGATLVAVGSAGTVSVAIGGAIRWAAYRKSLSVDPSNVETIQQLLNRQRSGNIAMLIAAPIAAVGLAVGIPILARGIAGNRPRRANIQSIAPGVDAASGLKSINFVGRF